MKWELWDLISGNRIGVYQSLEAAQSVIKSLVMEHGWDPNDLGLAIV